VLRPFDERKTLGSYALATVGALRLLFFSGGRAVAMWEVAIPVLGLVLLGYTLYRNVIPWPSRGALWGPGLAIATLTHHDRGARPSRGSTPSRHETDARGRLGSRFKPPLTLPNRPARAREHNAQKREIAHFATSAHKRAMPF